MCHLKTEDKDKISFSHALLSCHRWQRKRKKKNNSSSLSLLSLRSLQNNLKLLRNSFCSRKQSDNNNNRIPFKIPHNTSILLNKRVLEWEQNARGFQRSVPANDNNEDGENVVRPLSSSVSSMLVCAARC